MPSSDTHTDRERIERLEQKVHALHMKLAERDRPSSSDDLAARVEAIERALITSFNVDPRQP
jgi:hypothetical protein